MEAPVLEGPHVRLEPLRPEHLPALEAIEIDDETWTYMTINLRNKEAVQRWADDAWRMQREGTVVPWVTFLKDVKGGFTLVGATRFMDYDPKNKSTEIGNTWIAPAWRGSLVNTEAKYLQLTYAFEGLGFQRVYLKSHSKNLRSQAAIKRLGAKYEGTFRKHMIMPDGSIRDSVFFSILDEEWPEVKAMLEARLAGAETR